MTTNSKPEFSVKFGSVRASVWKNEGKNGSWYSITIVRVYKQGDEYKESSSFSLEELPLVQLVADRAFHWVAEHQ